MRNLKISVEPWFRILITGGYFRWNFRWLGIKQGGLVPKSGTGSPNGGPALPPGSNLSEPDWQKYLQGPVHMVKVKNVAELAALLEKARLSFIQHSSTASPGSPSPDFATPQPSSPSEIKSSSLKEPASATPATEPVKPPGSTGRRSKPRIIFEDRQRIETLAAIPLTKGGAHFYDPQCDVPLDEGTEDFIDTEGAFAFLNNVLSHNNCQLNEQPVNEAEARRAARKVIRSLPQYDGERFIQ